jgi:hypothetical protein
MKRLEEIYFEFQCLPKSEKTTTQLSKRKSGIRCLPILKSSMALMATALSLFKFEKNLALGR